MFEVTHPTKTTPRGKNKHKHSLNSQQQSSGDSKNLSHVPCKFYKQGACQAGSSCPFSHTLDPVNDSTPCKYFQKGNCKFGSKCALAHILPDGRRVNPKSLAQVYQNHNSVASMSPNDGTVAANVSNVAGINNSGMGISNISINSSGSGSPSASSTANTTHYMASSPFSSGSIWSSTPATLHHSNSASYSTRPVLNFSTKASGSSSNYHAEVFEDYTSDIDDNDEVLEDFVPSSLSELLTPQELKRRGSRPTSARPVLAPVSVEDDTQFRMD